MRACILLLLMPGILHSSPSLAFEGRYRAGWRDYRQELTIKRQDAGRYGVELVVGTEGCSGYFEGIGRVEGATLIARSPPPADPEDKCVVSISRNGRKLEVSEDHCTWHGASCEFAGTYNKR
jgi:hypothetical protein